MAAAPWAHAAFALGYAEHGEFPPSARTQAACIAAQEGAIELDDPRIGPLVIEAGRIEGKRAAREKAHSTLYNFHAEQLGAAVAKILARIDVESVAAKALEVAKAQSDAGYSAVDRRKAVQAIALGAIGAAVSDEDHQELNDLNAAGWAHATAHGSAEAQTTPAKGGPPEPPKIAAATALALSQIEPGQAVEASSTWAAEQMQSVAMGAALAAGDGSALGDATRAVTSALTDTGRATAAYANQLHGAVVDAYLTVTQAQSPGAKYDWLTGADPCEDCTDNELEGPYEWADVPGCPAHFRCQCNVELASTSVLIDA